jgi:gluconate 2-dehydrogenase gamma chain
LPNPARCGYDLRKTRSGGADLKRRTFLSTAALAAAACNHRPAAYRFFTPAEAATLGAWVDALIPADQDPGAWDAGVVNYIDRYLMRRFRKQQPAYRAALAAVDRMARAAGGKDFAALPFDERSALLATLEDGQADRSLFPDGGKAAFNMVLDHTMQGYYGDPRHGGNKDYASWRMIGVPPMPVRGRLHYDVKDTFPERS